MINLIEAMQIFLKYVEAGSYQEKYPTNCSHDELTVVVDPELVSAEDLKRLDELGFSPDGDYFTSYHYGSC